MKVGILGATGAVGQQMIKCIEERNLNVEELRLFASEKSRGKKLKFNNKDILIDVANEESFVGLDYVLGAVSNSNSKMYWPMIKESGAIYIDNSSAFRLEDWVPLVVPEINGKDALKNNGLIGNPNCSTIITYMALAPIAKLSKLLEVTATTFQAVSGAGIKGFAELDEQINQIQKGEIVKPNVFPNQIAFNVIAEIGDFKENGFTTEEMKMLNEGRKIMHLPNLKVDCTCVRVPVYRSHSISVMVKTKEPLQIDEVKKEINKFEGLKLIDEHTPTPIETSDQDKVYVGRIRKSLIDDNKLLLWCCGDQIRKGAATNAVQIMEYVDKHKN